jgi:hypothetical protein
MRLFNSTRESEATLLKHGVNPSMRLLTPVWLEPEKIVT